MTYLEKTGFDLDSSNYYDESLSKRLCTFMSENMMAAHQDRIKHSEWIKSLNYLFCLHPNLDILENGEVNLKHITLWLNQKARDKDRAGRTQMKVGKAFKMICPNLTPVDVEKFVDKFKEFFGTKDYEVKQGLERKDFIEAYGNNIESQQNIDSFDNIKRLSDSCMSGKTFDYTECEHPAEIYASCEFSIYWAVNPKGEISGRCVVGIKNPESYQAGPIYATSNQAYEEIKKAIESDCQATEFDDPDVRGFKVLVLEDGGGIVAPYFDFIPRHFGHDGLIGGYDYEADETDGFACGHNGGTRCERCGNTYDNDAEGGIAPDCESYCQYCYDENVGYCEKMDESCWYSDMQDVYVSEGSTEFWSEYALDNYATYIQGEYYCNDSNLFFISEWNGEAYLIDDYAETVDYEIVSIGEIQNDRENTWKQNNDGLWFIETPEEE